VKSFVFKSKGVILEAKKIYKEAALVCAQFLDEGDEVRLRMTHLQPPLCGGMLYAYTLWMHVLFNPAIVYLPFKTETERKRELI